VETPQLQADNGSEDNRTGQRDRILPQGTVVQDRYKVIKVVGLGGMGAVYQVQDLRFTGTKRLCALKEMISTVRDGHTRRIAVQSFEREANILAGLNHPAIPKIFDYFTEDVRNYLVLEFVEGMDLEAVLSSVRTPLPVDRVADWAIQMCKVLSYLHFQTPPIMFRDLKPSNIMIRSPNQIVLIDFGIARVFQTEQKGTMIGTEGYSPPEQYRGTAKPEGDIYALGATLHHLLSRRDPRLHPPFTFHEESIRTLNPDVSDELEAVIMRALEYETAGRFASADEMKAALQECLEENGQKQKSAKDVEGHPTTADSTDTVWIKNETPSGTTGDEGILPIWQFECEEEVRSSPVIADGIVYVGCYDNNLYALDAATGKFQWKFATEGGIAATPCVWKDRVLIGSEDQLLYAISTSSGRILWTFPTEGRVRSSARIEFEHAFFGSDDRRLYATNAHSGREVWRFEALDCIRSTPAVGGEIVYVGSEDNHLYALDLQTGRQRWKFRTNHGITSSPILHQGLVVFGSSDWNVYALDEKSGWSVWRFRTGQVVVGSPRAVDGVVFIGSADGYLYALDANRGRQVWRFDAGYQIVSTPAVSGGALYFGTIGGEVISLDVKSGKERWRFATSGPMPSSPSVSEGIVYIGSNDHHVYALPA